MQKRTEQQTAKDLYLHTEKTQQEIADILDVNRRTVYMWIKDGKWQEMKLAARQAPGMIMQDMFNHITEINKKIYEREDRCPTMEEVEKLRKLVNITNVIHKRHYTGSYVQAYAELVSFTSKTDRDAAEFIMKHADRYIKGTLGSLNFHLKKECERNVNQVMDNIKMQYETASPFPPPDEEFMTKEEIAAAANKENETKSETKEVPSCDDDGSLKTAARHSETSAKPLPTKPHTKNDNATQTPIPAISRENGSLNTNSSGELQTIKNLPPEKRPSPFRDGNILWVNNIDDADNKLDNFGNPWGELKMGDVIRRYPDLDPVLKRA